MIESKQPDLTPSEIAANLADAGLLSSQMASVLEQRIIAYADRRSAEASAEARTAAIREALQKAEGAIRRIRGDRMKDAALRVVGAIKSLLPDQAAAAYELEKAKEQSYRRGVRDGRQIAVKGKRTEDR